MSAARLCVPCDALWRSVALREASLAGLNKKWLIKMLSLDILRRWVSGGVPGQPQLATCFPPNVTDPEARVVQIMSREGTSPLLLLIFPKEKGSVGSAMQFPDEI